MRINDVTQVGVLSMTAVPVFRAHEGTRVFTSALVEHISCLHVATESMKSKGTEVFFLKSLVAERVAVEALAVEALGVESLMGTGAAPASELSAVAGVALEDVQLRGPVLTQDPVQGYGRQIQRQAKDGLTSGNGTSGFNADVPSTTGTNGTTSTTGTTSTNGTNPIDPWDLRTSSPPG